MSRENEQLAQSLNTSESVVDYLINYLGLSEIVATALIMNDEPTPTMIIELFARAVPADEDSFFWGDVEYSRGI